MKDADEEENWENDQPTGGSNNIFDICPVTRVVWLKACRKKKVLMKLEGTTPAARRQFRIDERRRLQSLDVEKKLALKGMGKLLVTSPKELMIAKPDPRGVAADPWGVRARYCFC